MALSDYEQQVLRLKRWNKTVMLLTAGLMLLVFFMLLGYAVYQGQQRQAETQQVLDYITKQREVTSRETAITREGGDIIRCMLLITNTTPPEQRTLEQVNKCYPGGSPEAWAKHRAEALGE